MLAESATEPPSRVLDAPAAGKTAKQLYEAKRRRVDRPLVERKLADQARLRRERRKRTEGS